MRYKSILIALSETSMANVAELSIRHVVFGLICGKMGEIDAQNIGTRAESNSPFPTSSLGCGDGFFVLGTLKVAPRLLDLDGHFCGVFALIHCFFR